MPFRESSLNRVQPSEPCPFCGNRTVVKVSQQAAPDGWFRRQSRKSWVIIALLSVVLAAITYSIWQNRRESVEQTHRNMEKHLWQK